MRYTEVREKKARGEAIIPCQIDQANCTCSVGTEQCIQLLGCPAIIKEDKKTMIDSNFCIGCGVCMQVCPYQAITRGEP